MSIAHNALLSCRKSAKFHPPLCRYNLRVWACLRDVGCPLSERRALFVLCSRAFTCKFPPAGKRLRLPFCGGGVLLSEAFVVMCSGDGASSPRSPKGGKAPASLSSRSKRGKSSRAWEAGPHQPRDCFCVVLASAQTPALALLREEQGLASHGLGLPRSSEAGCRRIDEPVPVVAQAPCSSMNLPNRGKKKSKDAAASQRCDQYGGAWLANCSHFS